MKGINLMLNNYIKHTQSNEICLVRRIGSNLATVGITGRKVFGHSKDFEPIPLTEEILLKCPEISKCTFREDRWNIRHKEGQFHIIKFDNRFVFRGAGMSVIYVDTLHHLQNLVFVNTGKELEVKP